MLRRREAALLDDARGACFELLPASGHLRPWGQMAIAISVHSNMTLAYPTPSRTPSLALAYPTRSPTPNPDHAAPPLPQVHSNMWGKYEDVLVSELEGLPPEP